MADQNDIKTEVIKGTVEVIKTAYDDALKPVAGETGKALGTLGQTVNLMLEPLRGVIWGYDRIGCWIKSKLEEKLEAKGVRPEDLITPDPDIAVPTIEALRYTKLREQYANLLATAMDQHSCSRAHPSFVELLKQLTPDEAKIIHFLPPVGHYVPTMDLDYSTPGKGTLPLYVLINTLDEDANCDFPEAVGTYMNNLCRLGITEIPFGKAFADLSHYDRIKALPVVAAAATEIPSGTKLEHLYRVFGLTVLGQNFKDVCIGSSDKRDETLAVPNLSQNLRKAD